MAEPNTRIEDPEGLVLRYLEDPQPDLKDLIVDAYSGMVERIARRFCGIEPVDDLIQVGYIGLLNALSKFDPNAGVRFNTYATHLVAGEIKHYLRDRTQTIRHPAWLQELRHRVVKASSQLQVELSRPPTDREIAERLGVPESSVKEVASTQELLRIVSLDTSAAASDDGDSDLEKLDSGANCREQLSVEDRIVLESAMGQLRDLEQRVLTLFHFDSLNQTEIANQLGISCNYVSHILRQSLAKLRRILTVEEHRDWLLRKQAGTDLDHPIDPVAGVYTEQYFDARLIEEVHRAKAQDSQLALVIIEFRGTQAMRNYYGPESVTDFLADAGAFLKGSVRRLDIVCRMGEAGFAVLLPTTGPTVSILKDRLNASLTQWLSERQAPSGPITVHIGCAVLPDECSGPDELRERARPAAPPVPLRTLRPAA